MEKIKLHVISAWTPEKNDLLNERGILRVSWAIEDFISILNSYNSKSNLGGLADILFRDIGTANRYAKENFVYNLLYYYSQLNYANFLIRLNVGKPVQFTIADKEIESIGEFKNSEIGTGHVIAGIAAARILRNQPFLDFYANIPVTLTEQQNQEDIIGETMMYFYQTLIKGTADKDTAAVTHYHINSFLDWEEYKKYIKAEGFNSESVWKIVFDSRKQTTGYFLFPLLEIYHYILHQDQVGYEKAVYEALVKWKAFFTRPKYIENGQEFDYSTSPSGYLALEIAAACAYAYDRGMKLETVESDYIPKWMIEGRFDNFELLIKGDSPA
ncbi:Imm49 family immunity protein [Runella limosa]|uniref:Imm49 family immunity protein n=1 Tax=Runella limosa TaxID=370978 RepID=UPI0004231364|nr:Imm49 family immunity protein [Runella limosa]